MKKLIFTFILSISLSVFASIDRVKLPEQSRGEILNLLKLNEGLHSSFFKYKEKDVVENAKKISESISAIKDQEVKKLLRPAWEIINKIKPGTKREANNKLYNEFSSNLAILVEKYDLGKKYNVYYCSMVKKKWIQNSLKVKKVNNPYAPEMPFCGEKLTDF